MSHAPLLSLFQSFGAVELSLVLVGLSFFFLISLFSWSFDGSNILSLSPVDHPINLILISTY